MDKKLQVYESFADRLKRPALNVLQRKRDPRRAYIVQRRPVSGCAKIVDS